jgi:Co-chaperonin GroES (HSP10)
MSVNIRPLGDRVLVEPIEQEETIAGGMLVLPETAKEKPQQGNVIAVGAGRRDESGKRIDMDVKKGDKVLFAKYAGTEVKTERSETPHHEGERYPGDRGISAVRRTCF